MFPTTSGTETSIATGQKDRAWCEIRVCGDVKARCSATSCFVHASVRPRSSFFIDIQILEIKRDKLYAVAVVELVLELNPGKAQRMQRSRKALHNLPRNDAQEEEDTGTSRSKFATQERCAGR